MGDARVLVGSDGAAMSKLLNAAEVGALLGLSKRWVYENRTTVPWLKAAVVEFGSTVRFRPGPIEAFIAGHEVKPDERRLRVC